VRKAADSLGPPADNAVLGAWMADILEGAPATRLPRSLSARAASA
jgi:hypothetical protein